MLTLTRSPTAKSIIFRSVLSFLAGFFFASRLNALCHFLSRFSRSCLPCDLNFIQIDCNRLAVLRPFIAVLLAPCLNEQLDPVASILCRGNAYKEIPDIVSANLYLIDAGLCHPVDNLD